MIEEKIQRAVSEDGTEIAGRRRGQGPSLVFVHGVSDDGDTGWAPLLPFMTHRFTCYTMSTRGRGLSGNSADHSRERHVQDIAAFVDSIGGPTGLVGHSGGGLWALGAAARTRAVSAVAAYEPAVVNEVANERDLTAFRATVARVAEAAAEGRPAEGLRTFIEFVGNDEETRALQASGHPELAAYCAPILVDDISQGALSQAPTLSSPSVLAQITVPVLLLHGSNTSVQWFTDGVDHVAQHLPQAEKRVVDGAGHLCPLVRPQQVANELVRFFENTLKPA